MNSAKISTPHGMNIELTNRCPLRCPQCYCTLEGGKDIPFETASGYIRQAKDFGIKHVELSGGETLCYPYLYDLISLAHECGLETSIAISGWHFTESCLTQLINAGLSNLFVSLNGPTEEINRATRDGYQYAISALQLLHSKGFANTYINWVMHRSNADSLPEMLLLAQKYSVRSLVILSPKPTSRNELNTFPTLQQIQAAAQTVKNAKPRTVMVQSCFSPLLAIIQNTKLFGNLNVGRDMGCGAGRNLLSVNVDGMLSPCRHLDYFEQWDSLEDYWNQSDILRQIRALDGQKEEPCTSCKFCDNCRHCLAINSKIKNKLVFGNDLCPIAGHENLF